MVDDGTLSTAETETAESQSVDSETVVDPAATRELTREELRTTFEYQVQRLQEIDSKAIEILKANLLLIGIVVTGGSVLIQTDLAVGTFLNSFTLTGGLLLLASTGLAAVTYTASNLRGGLDTDAVERAIGAEADGAAFERRLLRSYGRWIEYNARVTAVNDLLATITVLLVFVAFVYVVAGVAVGGAGLSAGGELVAFGVVTLLMGAFSWFGFHMDHLGADDERHPGTFEGVQLSKGASRQDGVAALKDMLTDSSDERDREQ